MRQLGHTNARRIESGVRAFYHQVSHLGINDARNCECASVSHLRPRQPRGRETRSRLHQQSTISTPQHQARGYRPLNRADELGARLVPLYHHHAASYPSWHFDCDDFRLNHITKSKKISSTIKSLTHRESSKTLALRTWEGSHYTCTGGRKPKSRQKSKESCRIRGFSDY
jgi:hypothetical protein